MHKLLFILNFYIFYEFSLGLSPLLTRSKNFVSLRQMMAGVKRCPSGADTVLPSYAERQCQLLDKAEGNGGHSPLSNAVLLFKCIE